MEIRALKQAVYVGMLLVAAASVRAADRTVSYGAQASLADDAGLGVGVRALVDLSGKRAGLFGIGSFDYFFDDGKFWELNGNAAYTLHHGGRFQPYVGAGLNLAHGSGDTELGLNVLAGINVGASGRGFVEARLELGGAEQFIACAGIRF